MIELAALAGLGEVEVVEVRANRCRRHHSSEQLPQVFRRHPLDKRSSRHLRPPKEHAN
ncbi:hypothetical protein [Streptomyces sp. NPDC006552]|uniref:hypothetical protein n=1 Tax=Streptomyces sp. NPDC006552 TaxID=3157179 RepID=UPI0033ACD2AB